MPDIGDGGMEAANHLAMQVPMQQSRMICTRTPEPKYNKKINKERKTRHQLAEKKNPKQNYMLYKRDSL